MFASGESAFMDHDQPEDFSFMQVSAATEAERNNGRHNNHKVTVATHGWNRLKNVPMMAKRLVPEGTAISGICGKLVDTAGDVYYLTRWSDGAITWEYPGAFEEAQDVLEKYELASYARKRKDLCESLRRPEISYLRDMTRRRIGSLEANRNRSKAKELLTLTNTGQIDSDITVASSEPQFRLALESSNLLTSVVPQVPTVAMDIEAQASNLAAAFEQSLYELNIPT
ncbi:hypothetical protein EC988_009397, partial [Linderina pennispora]